MMVQEDKNKKAAQANSPSNLAAKYEVGNAEPPLHSTSFKSANQAIREGAPKAPNTRSTGHGFWTCSRRYPASFRVSLALGWMAGLPTFVPDDLLQFSRTGRLRPELHRSRRY